MSKKSTRRRASQRNRRSPISSFLRKPLVQFAVVLIAALAIFLIVSGSSHSTGGAAEVGAEQAYQMYQRGAFILDVRTQGEWDQFHIPNATLIPLEELSQALDQVPRDRQIIVVCRTGVRSRTGRDILLQAGFQQVTCLYGGMTAWQAAGYPTVSGP